MKPLPETGGVFVSGKSDISTPMKIARILILCAAVAAFPQSSLSPRAEIDSLLAFVRRQEEVVFIRNGGTHTAAEAEAHLRLKWSRQEKDIRSAEDFIERCATRSFLTRKTYAVRFPDGTERLAAEVLHEELARLRGGGAESSELTEDSGS